MNHGGSLVSHRGVGGDRGVCTCCPNDPPGRSIVEASGASDDALDQGSDNLWRSVSGKLEVP